MSSSSNQRVTATFTALPPVPSLSLQVLPKTIKLSSYKKAQFSYQLNVASTVSLTLQQQLSGYLPTKGNHTCGLKKPKKGVKFKKCTFLKQIHTFALSGQQGGHQRLLKTIISAGYFHKGKFILTSTALAQPVVVTVK